MVSVIWSTLPITNSIRSSNGNGTGTAVTSAGESVSATRVIPFSEESISARFHSESRAKPWAGSAGSAAAPKYGQQIGTPPRIGRFGSNQLDLLIQSTGTAPAGTNFMRCAPCRQISASAAPLSMMTVVNSPGPFLNVTVSAPNVFCNSSRFIFLIAPQAEGAGTHPDWPRSRNRRTALPPPA